MNGCKKCPAFAKCAIPDYAYRGSRCAALRYTYGLDADPEVKTNADCIRGMSDEQLATFLSEWAERSLAWHGEYGETLGWLQEPAKEG